MKGFADFYSDFKTCGKKKEKEFGKGHCIYHCDAGYYNRRLLLYNLDN